MEHHGVTLDEVEEALDNIVEEQIQPDGRRRVWGWAEDNSSFLMVDFSMLFLISHTPKREVPHHENCVLPRRRYATD